MPGTQADRDAAVIAANALLELAAEMRRNHPELLSPGQIMLRSANSIRTLEATANLLKTLAGADDGRSNPQSDYRGRD
jgi:hypothetical protein